MMEQHEALRNLIIDYKRVFGTEEGKRVLLDLMNHFNFMNPIQAKDDRDFFVHEGRRQVVQYILRQYGFKEEELIALVKGE